MAVERATAVGSAPIMAVDMGQDMAVDLAPITAVVMEPDTAVDMALAIAATGQFATEDVILAGRRSPFSLVCF